MSADLATARREAEEARARLLAADTARERSYAMEDCVVALEALLAATAEPAAVSIIHACPVSGHALTPCCGRSPFDIPSSDRITLNAAVVTCRRQEAEPAPALPEEVREAAEKLREDLGYINVRYVEADHGSDVADVIRSAEILVSLLAAHGGRS